MSRLYSRPAPDAGMIPVPNLPLAFRPAVAARALGISPRSLWTLTKAGRVPFVRLGKCVVYPVPGLVRFLEEQTVNPIVRRPDADDAARGIDGTEVAR